MRAIYDGKELSGTLTASTAATGYPASNVRHPFRTRPWRSQFVGDQWLKWDMGSAVSVNCVGIVNHNFPSDVIVKFQGNATDSWATPSVDETITYSSGIMAKYFTGGSYRYWRVYVEVADTLNGVFLLDGSHLLSPSSTLEYISVGRVMFGTAFAPAQTFAYGWDDGAYDPSAVSQSLDGQFYVDLKDQYEVIGLSLNLAEAADKTLLRTLFSTVGTSKNLIVTLDETDVANTTYYGRLTESPRLTNQVSDRISYALKFAEAV